jgi:predicted esterase
MDEASTQKSIHMNDSRTLNYETFLLGTADDAAERPFIIPLHYMGSSPSQICDILLRNVDFSARVIAPYGQFPFEDQYTWFPEELYDKPESEQGRFVDRCADILLENVAVWQQQYPTRGKPIFLGVSQGGDICFSLAARFGDRFSLCLPVAGRMLRDKVTKRPNSGIVRVHHGADDPIVPIATAREAASQLQSAGLEVQLREYAGVTHAVPAKMQQAIHDDIGLALTKTV